MLLHADEGTIARRLAARDEEHTSPRELTELLCVQRLLLDMAPADDLVVVDTTHRSVDETVETIWPDIAAAALPGAVRTGDTQ